MRQPRAVTQAQCSLSDVSVSDLTGRIIKLSVLEARMLKSETVDTEHLLLALLHNPEIQHMEFIVPFRQAGIDYQSVLKLLSNVKDIPQSGFGATDEEEDDEDEDAQSRSSASYDKRDDAYRHKQLEIFRLADGVLCQGECFVDFIKEKLGRDSFYYPNFIDDEFISTLKPRNIDGEIRLVYFGRVAPSKNVDQVIRATALLRRSYPGARLDIIGGVDPEYKTLLDRAVEESGLPADAIRYHGPQSLEYIVGVLQAAHFFVFPTAYEGHSNALTEAMACGAVPVASDVGFNASIIGDKSLVIDSLDAKDYAERMAEILQSGQINTLSASVQNRIISHYTRSLVAPRLTAYIRSMENRVYHKSDARSKYITLVRLSSSSLFRNR